MKLSAKLTIIKVIADFILMMLYPFILIAGLNDLGFKIETTATTWFGAFWVLQALHPLDITSTKDKS